jgi:hypothetical protein
MTTVKQKLVEAEAKATQLFEAIENNKILVAGKTETEINTEIFVLAEQLFGIQKYWHKRIVRAGANTLLPYQENPQNLVVQADDILFLDFGPIFEDFEADFGRTYVIGNDIHKIKLKNDVEQAWYETKHWFDTQTTLTGAALFSFVEEIAKKYTWTFGGEIAGHLIGKFPHEKLEAQNYGLYVHPNNFTDMFCPDANGNQRHWILEIHFIDREKQIGGFFEQLLT